MRQSPRQSEMQRQIAEFRARVEAMEEASTRLLSAAYADALATLEPRIVALANQIEAARAAGETVNVSWLFQQERYQELRRQIIAEMDRYAVTTATITTQGQQLIVRESIQQAGELLAVSGGSGEEIATLARGWAGLPDDAIANMVGAVQQSTPLGQTLATYGSDAVTATTRALTDGLALGLGVNDTARNIERALGLTRTRAEVLVRTETLRASRAALAAAFEQSGVVRALRWSASLSSRTCPACLHNHGKLFPLGTVMAAHSCCRCTWSPVVVGIDDVWQSGESWLRSQPASVQEEVFSFHGGAEAAQAFRDGELTLDDFTILRSAKSSVPRSGASGYGRRNAQTWGQSWEATSLTQARKRAEARRAA